MPRALFLLWLLVRFGAVLLNSLLRKRQLKTIAFFHPFADGGGGGEKVLWWAVKITQEALPSATVALFTGGNLSGAQLRQLALERFNVKLGRDPLVVSLRCRDLLQPDRYKVATIAAQALASCLVTLEVRFELPPSCILLQSQR